MIDIIFTFLITFLIISVSWFVPKAGTSNFTGVTKKELSVIAVMSVIPAILVTIFT